MSNFEIEIHDSHPIEPKKCELCGIVFDPAWRAHPDADLRDYARIKYCSEKCARSAENKRNYERHKTEKQARARENMRRLYNERKEEIASNTNPKPYRRK